ncbi:putative Ig domain-containing protein [Catenulispora sp. EB89]|uniref:putative Ig domain-containing protein n=1 Tax=Catenulispora sp. EB89 TaxID=3156257 RepID=UPI003515E88E
MVNATLALLASTVSTVSTAAVLVGVAAGSAAAKADTAYPPPSIRLQCPAADGEALHGSVCALPPGVTTAPDGYSATVAVAKAGAAGATVTYALTAGSLPPGLTLPAQSSSLGTVISGNPTQAGTFDFTLKATDGNLTSTLAYQITVTVRGLPDQLQCGTADGSFLINGACVLPDSIAGRAYQGHLPTSHNAGGTIGIVSGALPAGLSLSSAFGPSGALVSGTPATASNVNNTYNFTVQGTGDLGQPLYQAYQITVDPDQPLSIVLPGIGSTLSSGTVGEAYAQNFFLSGGAAPYTWAVVGGQLPPGLAVQTFSDPRDADDELAGTPTTAGTYTFTVRLTDFIGQQATQQFSLTITP